MLRSMLFAVLLAMTPTAAFAHMCPSLMAEIDAALPTATISEGDKATVMELRERGEELHNAGDHDASVQALQEAKALLGI